jgi:protein ImuB
VVLCETSHREWPPRIVVGDWWSRPVHRAYHFAETKDGETLWVFYDRAQRRWFLQGRVE